MLLRSILAFLPCFITHAFSISILDSDLDLPAPTATRTNVPVVSPTGQLDIVNNVIAPDGYPRAATLVNGVHPGPLIKANKGDEFAITVANRLEDRDMDRETSVNKSAWADGVSWVTQCPLRPQESFVQRFNITGQTGTYWYHSHDKLQLCDGLRGPLVIYDPEDPLAALYNVDNEHTVITLSDWYDKPIGQVDARLPNSTLVNGRGRPNATSSAPLSVINVQQGLRYRFRVVGMSCVSSFNFTIDGHRMTIIEVDGTEVFPTQADSLRVFPAQRYSVVVQADQPVGNYWIRALRNQDNANFHGGQNKAILRYEGAPVEDPETLARYDVPFDESNLHPLITDPRRLGKPEKEIVLHPRFNFTTDQFALGNVSWNNPTTPVLLQILHGRIHPSELVPQGAVYTLPPNKLIEISFPNPAPHIGGPHPIHLHGHNFDVVRLAGSDRMNLVDPIRRDVVSLGSSQTDNVAIRFVTDNWGPWFLHCHIDPHLNNGFAVVLAEAPKKIQQEKPPHAWYELCNEGQNWGQTRLLLDD
ncbi:laccase [Imleria badia]|nr:laccase [Imleria badia]